MLKSKIKVDLDMLRALDNTNNAIRAHMTNIDPTTDNYGDVQKDLVLAIRGYSMMFKELTGINYQV